MDNYNVSGVAENEYISCKVLEPILPKDMPPFICPLCIEGRLQRAYAKSFTPAPVTV